MICKQKGGNCKQKKQVHTRNLGELACIFEKGRGRDEKRKGLYRETLGVRGRYSPSGSAATGTQTFLTFIITTKKIII